MAAVGEELSLNAALLELLDHPDEEVAVGIMLPSGEPWAGGTGVLQHTARKLMGEGPVMERVATSKDWTGHFIVGSFSIPLDRAQAVRRTKSSSHPGLNFEIGGEPTFTVRFTYLEHDRPDRREA